MPDSSSSSRATTARTDAIERCCEAYLERVAAGEEPDLEAFAADLTEAERATYRVDALAGELLWRQEAGEGVELEQFVAKLPTEEERARLREQVEGAREATRQLPWHLEAGARLGGGRFEIVGELGHGGIGTVYEAHDHELDRRVALKAMRVDPTRDAQELKRSLVEESQTLAGLKSANIVTIFDVLREGDRVCVVLDRIEGDSLAEAIDELRKANAASPLDGPGKLECLRRAAGIPADGTVEGPLGDSTWYRAVASLGARLAATMARAHGEGVLHRDLKPQNVMLQPDGEPVLLDFGLAHRLGRERDGERPFQGTPEYLAPEQVASMETGEDPRTDVYALGLVLYELIALERAFPRTTQEPLPAFLERVRKQRFTRLSSLDPHVPAGLLAICERAMAGNLAQRYGSMAELREDLERFLDQRPPRYAHVPWAHRYSLELKRLVRNPLAAAALLIVLGSAWAWTEAMRTPPALSFVQYFRQAPGQAPERVEGEIAGANDALGIVLKGKGVLYALSVFGPDRNPENLRVKPTQPVPIINGDAVYMGNWGLYLRSGGMHMVMCTYLKDGQNERQEGMITFLCPKQDAVIESWLADISDQNRVNMDLGVAYLDARKQYEDLGTARGGNPADIVAQRIYPSVDEGSQAKSLGIRYFEKFFEVRQ